jgi:hypothetical protein
MAALALAASNNVVAMCLAAYVGICVGMLGHRLFWPILERPLYAACRFGLVRRKKLLGAAGVTLLAAAIPGVAELLKQFAEVLGR